MSGPIVRTGTNPKFWSNWDQAFGKSSAASSELQAEAEKRVKKAAKKVDAANQKAMAKKAAPKKAAVKTAVVKAAAKKTATKKAAPKKAAKKSS